MFSMTFDIKTSYTCIQLIINLHILTFSFIITAVSEIELNLSPKLQTSSYSKYKGVILESHDIRSLEQRH